MVCQNERHADPSLEHCQSDFQRIWPSVVTLGREGEGDVRRATTYEGAMASELDIHCQCLSDGGIGDGDLEEE